MLYAHKSWYTGVVQQEEGEGKNKYQTDKCYNEVWVIFWAVVIQLGAIVYTEFGIVPTRSFRGWLENGE